MTVSIKRDIRTLSDMLELFGMSSVAFINIATSKPFAIPACHHCPFIIRVMGNVNAVHIKPRKS